MLAVAYATGRASHARQVKGDDPYKKGYPDPPGWGFGVRLTTPHSKNSCYETLIGIMIPLATKQSGGKLLPHSDLREGVFLGEASHKIQREMG
jgi:hypothetical protein